ncbi:MAG TPA: AAA family ATPase, partial [Chthonomonadales bacterium]|nr:AAA family ATPase [Chthonomonadales bacterium]
MQIKKLQLVGFKTFADKTEIEFADGLTAVVGPNGCGKSNIADALLWVMGEQNPRLLRGSDSRDLIFAGTDRRKPLGMAEVCLTLDNTDRTLPLDFAEITITRRLFRSGESQYFLNNAPCRLKDIVELFLDTGLGKGAYSFVSQNEIDAVLSAHPEDRRKLFEEAAGIKRYRLKKQEAVRKLEQAEANLNRIRDILCELEQQCAPLAKQAETARRYLRLTERLPKIEVGLLMAEAQKVEYELYAARREHNLNREAVERLNAELTRLEKETESTSEHLAKTEQELEQAHLAYQTA